jgi:hypothetical protein
MIDVTAIVADVVTQGKEQYWPAEDAGARVYMSRNNVGNRHSLSFIHFVQYLASPLQLKMPIHVPLPR